MCNLLYPGPVVEHSVVPSGRLLLSTCVLNSKETFPSFDRSLSNRRVLCALVQIPAFEIVESLVGKAKG